MIESTRGPSSDFDAWDGPVADQVVDYPISSSTDRFVGRIWTVRTDSVHIGDEVVDRDVLVHTGAVAIIALDSDDRIFLIRQYRHPVGMMLFEPPAGLIDVANEHPLATAKRELAEEAGLVARRWEVLVDFFNSPGGSSEAIRVYLARDIEPRLGGRILTGEAEEQHLPGVWVPLAQAAQLVLNSKLGNPTAVIGVLAALTAKAMGWKTLRPADSEWAVRDELIATNRVRVRDLPER